MKKRTNLDGMGKPAVPHGSPEDYITIGDVRVTRCTFTDEHGGRCHLPGTVSGTSGQSHCMSHHLLILGEIEAAECAERIKRARVGLNHPVTDIFEKFHAERTGDNVCERKAGLPSLPYDKRRRQA